MWLPKRKPEKDREIRKRKKKEKEIIRNIRARKRILILKVLRKILEMNLDFTNLSKIFGVHDKISRSFQNWISL